MMRKLIAAALITACWGLGAARAEPAPAEELRSSVDQHNVKMSWRMPQQAGDVRYYVDICRFERGAWLRIFGAYVAQPPFTFQLPAPGTAYAWRVLSVDPGDGRSFTPTAWQILRIPLPSR
ncbi:MAG: hypothetical protein JO255_16135 [Alphaproteobacteria bacterium]|nr:hypothetical protein [Alphaproteobacteria bacterium]